jgi:hypothetical protein
MCGWVGGGVFPHVIERLTHPQESFDKKAVHS